MTALVLLPFFLFNRFCRLTPDFVNRSSMTIEIARFVMNLGDLIKNGLSTETKFLMSGVFSFNDSLNLLRYDRY